MTKEDNLNAIHTKLVALLDPKKYETMFGPSCRGLQAYISIRRLSEEDGREEKIGQLSGNKYSPFTTEELTYIAVQVVKAAEQVEAGLANFLKRKHSIDTNERIEVCYVLDMAKPK
ncbi:hypothetical protein CO180_00300 [candidate division WWE3 bacterium CG_4_9_14_3_um_filter_41_6]|uniref:Uncharacterized protein n=1 Tax=candidate division WWE3 bacterium CG_4_10_14_0_2_um_filter_41_14 TaxID=1975072 RepID=A0A2M7TJZ1_UNCKA|nr:MAG: hypothetical protein COY32_03160 [candidate division WWE3 bacterium CG_4_10_14_0_2_um_filter_41_14]PJA39611.1 MAG: hypothetical protein CO180_00300 [candidate division WWE3 bacterium CG_4_9_14_3_um_filter_41_6]